jgi:hypothetical protein
MSKLTKAYQLELKRTRTAVADHAEKVWKALPDYRDEQVPGFLDKVLPVVSAGQSRAVALTNAYMSRKLGIPPVNMDVQSLIGAAARNGVAPADVYTRAFTTVWTSIATIGFAAALEKGLSRLKSTADMDVAMASRNATVAFAQAEDKVVGWTRVADPSCCDFCQMLDGVETGPSEPQPLHNNCGCTADPIVRSITSSEPQDSYAPGEIFDQVAIEEHGELGPVITDKNYKFTGPDDLND